ncbi:YdcF family protein [Shimia aestuarii]|uniref:YdcF family protein n=1 Tax=Shimia aestuarii TaxID=254406 RepID=UPI000B874D48|nr:ElyC/SanA/YdcF family protein [Shimia aestuarii]
MRLISYTIVLAYRLLSIVGAAALFLAFLLFTFMYRTNEYETRVALPPTAIVFTGDFDRIHLGLELLVSEQVERVFITGVNGDAGLKTDRFAKQFGLNPDQASWITSGKIVLAPDAHTTFENALEAACWLDNQRQPDAVTLITSPEHMARASIALQRGIAPVNVFRLAAGDPKNHDRFKIDLVEFSKFTATWVVTLLPRALWPGNKPRICENR